MRQEEILQEIDEMGYPSEGIGCGLEDAMITDRKKQIMERFLKVK